MNSPCVRVTLLLWLALSGASFAQAPRAENAGASGPIQQPAIPETPPDQAAYTKASRILDPAAKIEALEKFKREYPESSYVDPANMAILATQAGRMPGYSARAREQAKAIYRAAPKESRGRVANAIAEALLVSDALLRDARDYAQRAVKSADEKHYIKERITAAAKQRKEPPSREALARSFREMRAPRLATLGRVEAALGNNKRAAELLGAAYADLPTNLSITGSLGEVTAMQGQDDRAIELLIKARLGGRITPSTLSALEAVYLRMHGGTKDGLERLLDAEYRKRFPNPITVKRYEPTPKRSSRVVLAEVFTGSGCPPCAAADLAFDAALERYRRDELAVIMYHQHVPRPDPMTNADSRARASYYKIPGVPTFVIDGVAKTGGGGRDNASSVFNGPSGFNKTIEDNLENPAGAVLTAAATIANGAVEVNASIAEMKGAAGQIRIHMALVEKELTFSGENTIRFHPMVVRSMGSAGARGQVVSQTPAEFTERFDIASVSAAIKKNLDDYESNGHRGDPFRFVEKLYRIDPARLAVVVFAQEVETRRVLQAVYVEPAPPPEVTYNR